MLILPLLDKHALYVAHVYQAAFAGYPWFDKLSIKEVMASITPMFLKPGFSGVVAVEGHEIVGAHWHDILSLGRLRSERGDDLAHWVIQKGYAEWLLVWERELFVHPDFQRKGFAHQLRQEFLRQLQSYQLPLLALTRLRADNPGTIKSAERIGMFDTGVTTPATHPGQLRHYWALPVG